MKVLLLNGSANQKGNTFTALSEMILADSVDKTKTIIVDVGDNNLIFRN